MWRPHLLVLQPTPYCNISCQYCYLGNRDDRRLMPTAVLEAVRDRVFSRLAPDAAPTIIWHAGEPTVAPISWYERAYALLKPVTPSAATFAIQSNGVAISDGLIEFLRRSNTRIGLSIDGPERFHDARRKTRAGGPTWALIMRNLKRLQSAGLDPNVISVLHPSALPAAEEYYGFYRDNEITQVSFSIDEAEGANATSSFDGLDYKPRVVAFLRGLLDLAFAEGYPLHIREIERIAHALTSGEHADNEQVQPWQIMVVAANGDVTSFSPEFMELKSPAHDNFCFGNILQNDFDELLANAAFLRTQEEVAKGVEKCRTTCKYFGVCGGGAPCNKIFENGSLESAETLFCRLSVQASADALVGFLSERARAPNAEIPVGATAHNADAIAEI